MTREQLCSYDGIEHRCDVPLDDIWLGPCPLLGAIMGDDAVAERWEDGSFDGLDPAEVEAAQRLVFDRQKARTIAVAHRLVWDLNLEFHGGKEN